MSDAPTKTRKSSNRLFFLLPLLFFAALCGVFFFQLLSGRNSQTIPSALIGKPVPVFNLPALEGVNLPGFSDVTSSKAPVTLINVWASWCGPCRAEHPYVEELGRDDRIKLFGLNYKDNGTNARAFLEELGNPYDAIGRDESGRVGIDFGVYGVPETFVIDQNGTIAYKFIGPINERRLKAELMPAIEKVLAAAAKNEPASTNAQ